MNLASDTPRIVCEHLEAGGQIRTRVIANTLSHGGEYEELPADQTSGVS